MKKLNGKRFGLLLVLLVVLVGLALAGCSSASTEPADPNVVTDIVWE